jgi:hypothetical protein
MRISKSAVLLSAVLIAASVTGATPASAATSTDIPGLEIGAIGYNAYGADRSWNRNAEYVDITNTSAGAVSVKGLVVEDAWRHAQPPTSTSTCNRFEVTGVPQADGTTTDMLPSGHTLRVYVGDGTPRVIFGTRHAVFMKSDVKCGYNGHILNNNGPASNRRAPWDTVWITLGTNSESKGYNFSFGYVAK